MWLLLYLGLAFDFNLPPTCGNAGQRFIGCYNGSIHIKPGMSMLGTDHVAFHEAYHALYGPDEIEAEKFAETYTGGYELKESDVYPEDVKYIYIDLNK